MKAILSNPKLLGTLIGSIIRPSNGGQLPSNFRLGTRPKMNSRKGPGAFVNTRRRKKNPNILTNGKIEINRVDGGRKNVSNTGNVFNATIEIFGRLCTVYDQNLDGDKYVLQKASDNYASTSVEIDISSELNHSTEFMINKKKSLEYRVVNVTTVFDYVRVPNSGDLFNKLLCWYTTDKVVPYGYAHENNVMKLNMYNNGLKQYGMILNSNNTKDDNLGWISSETDFPGTLKLTIGSVDSNYLEQGHLSDAPTRLGHMKICVNVLFKETDTTKTDLMEKVLLIDKLEKELNELKLQNEKLKRIGEKKQELNDLIEQVEAP
jgi:hypothetical protein